MKTGKKYIRYILFAVMLVAGDILIGRLLSVSSKKQQYDNRIGKVVRNEVKADIIILGSSEALNDYSPEVISRYTGQTCYNLGISGSNPIFHETMLDLLLLHHQPRLVIYNLDDYASLYTKPGIIFRKDMLYPYVDDPFINERVCAELKKNIFATRISQTYRENVNFVSGIKYLTSGREKPDPRTTNINAFGATLIENHPGDPVPAYEKNTLPLSSLTYNASYRQCLLNIQEKCRARRISLICCFPPQLREPTPGFREKLRTVIQPGVRVIDYADSLRSGEYFFDQEHLNNKGAAYFSQLISGEIKKTGF